MSKEFWTLIVDAVVSIVLYFVSKYAGASIFEDVKFLIPILQAIVLALIVKWTGERVEIRLRAMAELL